MHPKRKIIFLYSKIFRKRKKNIYKQELLLRLALVEKGIDPDNYEIRCDHLLGKNYVNEIELSIKYPDSFYIKSANLIPKNKQINYYFNGNTSSSGKRMEMLKPFTVLQNSQIISSNEGRNQENKNKFNTQYFVAFANSKFGLCPHQADWVGDKEHMWTYRFIESCFVEAIPVIFVNAPLGKIFTKDIIYYTDKDILEKNLFKDLNNPTYDIKIARLNRELAKEYFCLTDEECKKIKESI